MHKAELLLDLCGDGHANFNAIGSEGGELGG